MRVSAWTLTCVLAAATAGCVCGHGRLISPPGRSTMWRYGFNTSINYNDNQLFCGGFQHQKAQGYKCGVCGDPWDGPRDNEMDGKYYSGIIVRTYKTGAAIHVKVHITANHKGWFEFKLCPITNDTKKATHACLDKYPLQLVDGSGSRYVLPDQDSRVYTVKLRLPAAIQCARCVLQWRYHTGNSWGEETDPHTGEKKGCIGCGEQEEFYGCADIRIKGDNASGSGTTTKSSTQTSTTSTTTRTTKRTTTPKSSSSTTTTKTTTSTTTPKSTTSTSRKPTTTQTPSSGDTLKCRSVYPYNDESHTQWCNINCPAYCPSSHCECGQTLPPEKEKKKCVWLRASQNQASSDKWCIDNCNHVPPNCPETLCKCQ